MMRTAGVMVCGVELFVAMATVLWSHSVMMALLLVVVVVVVVILESLATTAARHSVVRSVTNVTMKSDIRRMSLTFITELQRYRLWFRC